MAGVPISSCVITMIITVMGGTEEDVCCKLSMFCLFADGNRVWILDGGRNLIGCGTFGTASLHRLNEGFRTARSIRIDAWFLPPEIRAFARRRVGFGYPQVLKNGVAGVPLCPLQTSLRLVHTLIFVKEPVCAKSSFACPGIPFNPTGIGNHS